MKSWYEQAQELNQSLERKDKVIDELRKKAKLVDKWVEEYNKHVGTKEENEFIHVFRRILVEHHMKIDK